jgi:hypothetical protein
MERHKTLTALANITPVVGAHQPPAQHLQWFLSESTWDPEELTRRRPEWLGADPLTAPHAQRVQVFEEHGDRKWGRKTAHVGRQYLANLGKTDNGVVSVNTLWADAGLCHPLHYRPYTPAPHFARGKADPQFRTKWQIAAELVRRAFGLDYVFAPQPSHCCWHLEGTVGSLEEAVECRFRDGHSETWWVLEVEAAPHGPEKPQRVLVATTDPRSRAPSKPPAAPWRPPTRQRSCACTA